MTKKLFTAAALTMLLFSACSGGAPAETGTPAATETQVVATLAASTEVPAVTETSAAASVTPPTSAATEGTAAPTNPPDCTNSAAFVADITIPDETNVAGGTAFTKTWRINNNGTCVWGPTYTLTHYSEERMGAPDSVPLAVTYPGQNLDVSVNLTAPSGTGKHQANFVIKNPAGLIMNVGDDSRLWVVINVTVTGAATVAATATLTPPAAGNTATSTSAVAASTIPAGGSGSNTTTCLFSIDRTKLTETIAAINAYRAQNGLPIFSVNAKLARAAQKHANDMACNKLTTHTGSDQSTPQSRVADTGYTASSVSENIQGSNPPLSGQEVVNGWSNDTTDLKNKENLASRNFTEVGVGYAFFEEQGYYVIVFAQP